MGRWVIVAGLVLLGIGLVLQTGFPLGRLPGDFWVRRGSVGFYFPLTTSLVVSLVLALLLALLRR